MSFTSINKGVCPIPPVNLENRHNVKNLILNMLMITVVVHLTYGQAVSGRSFYNPTGSYEFVSKKKIKDGETQGYSGKVDIKLLDSSHIAMSFYLNKGAPSYNSGSFVDTLEYKNSIALYNPESDTSCKITFAFSTKGITVDQIAKNYNNSCGFGQAVVVTGFYKKISARIPEIKDPLVEN